MVCSKYHLLFSKLKIFPYVLKKLLVYLNTKDKILLIFVKIIKLIINMSIAKIKLKTAIGELEQFLKDLGQEEFTNQAGQHLRQINEESEIGQIKALLVFYSPTPSDIDELIKILIPEAFREENIWKLKIDSITICINAVHWSNAHPSIDSLPYVLGIAVMLPQYTQIPDIYQHLESIMQSYPYLIVASPPQDKSNIESGITSLITSAIDYTHLNIEENQEIFLPIQLQKKLISDRIDWLKGYIGILSLEDLRQTLLLLTAQEEKTIKGKRQINQQQLYHLKSINNSNSAISEFLVILKGNLQNQFNLFEKGINSKVDQILKSHAGPFMQMVENNLQNLDELAEEERAKTTLVKIPSAFEAEFLTNLSNYLSKLGMEDLRAIKDTLDLISREIELFFKDKNMNYHEVSVRYATTERLDEIIRQILFIEKQFQAEKPKKGMYEFFMAIRKYQMLFMMLFSTFGLSFLKNMRAFMVPSTILLVGYGLFSVIKSVKKERLEDNERQLDRSKDTLRQESKRIASEFGRSWTRFISDFLKEQNENIAKQLEYQSKTLYQKSQSEEEEQRNKLQRIQTRLEMQERRIDNFRRNLSTWDRNLQKTLSDIKSGYIQASRK